jgi:hypothetical protein
MKDWFEKKGFEVEVPELKIAPTSVGAFSDYADNGDMKIRKDGKEYIVEIKQSSYDFDINTFPFENAIVNSYTGYESKNPKPDIHVIISKNKKYAYAIAKSVFDQNKQLKEIYDKYKERTLKFYTVSKNLLKIFEI